MSSAISIIFYLTNEMPVETAISALSVFRKRTKQTHEILRASPWSIEVLIFCILTFARIFILSKAIEPYTQIHAYRVAWLLVLQQLIGLDVETQLLPTGKTIN